MAEAVLQLLMEHDVEGVIGAGRHERAEGRVTYRNGYRDREFKTRLGSLNPRVPKLRQGSYFPPFLEPRRTSESEPANATGSRERANAGGGDPGSLDRRRLGPPGG